MLNVIPKENLGPLLLIVSCLVWLLTVLEKVYGNPFPLEEHNPLVTKSSSMSEKVDGLNGSKHAYSVLRSYKAAQYGAPPNMIIRFV